MCFLSITDGGDSYICYHCNKSSETLAEIVNHELKHHVGRNRQLSVRKQILDPKSGHVQYKSKHFHKSLEEVKERLDDGDKMTLDEDYCEIHLKRSKRPDTNCPHSSTNNPTKKERCERPDTKSPHSSTENPTKTEEEIESRLLQCLPQLLEKLKTIGRSEDFLHVIESIVLGKLRLENIALHLLLDVGHFLSVGSSSEMRYSQTSIDFWLVVQKLFKSKGLRFFRGIRSANRMKGN